MSKSALAVVIGLCACAPAFATTIDFENGSVSGGQIESDGFRFYGTSGVGPELYNLSAPNSTTSLHVITYQTSTYVMEAISGDSFSLDSLDAISLGSGIFMTGFYAAGGTVQFNVGYPAEWTSFDLDSSWNALERVEFSMGGDGFGASIDNLVVTAVPVPAAVWLFGSALAGLGWMRRKQTA